MLASKEAEETTKQHKKKGPTSIKRASKLAVAG
jgi:hypothetical protein